MKHWLGLILIGLLIAAGPASNVVQAQDEKPAAAEPAPEAAAAPAAAPADLGKSIEELKVSTGNLKVALDTVWVLVTAMLVFFMNLGFACVESGMCRAKNCVNILSKNFIVFAVTSLFFWLLGFGLMFGNGGDYVGTEGMMTVGGEDNSPATLEAYKGAYGSLNWTGVPIWAKFFFQLVFAGTAATIVSGAVAERIKYQSFIVFSALMAIVIYPVVGHWIWGGGWLAAKANFLDFAGSTQVHSIGGWAALTGILFLGPRIGKFGADGKANAIPGHNMTAATIGCLILWLGWFGFNPGSTMAADPGFISDVCVTTNTAAALATLTATITSWVLLGKPDIGMTLNGCLAGLVAVTAPCAWITVESSAIIGAIAGVLVVLAVIGFDKIKIDDPVGATSVHLVNGIFGTICVGLFSDPAIMASRGLDPTKFKGGLFFGGGMDQLIAQLTGVVATAVYVIIASAICWAVLKATMGIRVSREEEIEGLDHGEHGNQAYHGFVMDVS
ncbi:MAG: ammonium transporter [Planctomycetales bacterium]|nr:ammonium transporter [Planctomycetales bacterium]